VADDPHGGTLCVFSCDQIWPRPWLEHRGLEGDLGAGPCRARPINFLASRHVCRPFHGKLMKEFALIVPLVLIATSSAQACGSPAPAVGSDASVDKLGAAEAATEAAVEAFIAGDGPTSGLTACSWPAQFNDAAPRACHAGRVLVVCATPGAGAGCLSFCVSEGPVQCSKSNCPAPCQSQCADNEYGLICGGIGPPPPDASAADEQPPSQCRFVSAVPAGIGWWCCPCE
jgi:hypothetical protein